MELRKLDTRDAVRGAIRAHGYAWREAYADILPEDVLSRVTVEPTQHDIDQWRDRFPDEDEPGIVYGATVRDTVQGYIFVRWEETKPFVRPQEAGLKELYIHPDWWGGGLGTSLVSRALSELPPEIEGVALDTLADNKIGRSFYESRGFHKSDRGSIDIDGTSYETVIYRRQID